MGSTIGQLVAAVPSGPGWTPPPPPPLRIKITNLRKLGDKNRQMPELTSVPPLHGLCRDRSSAAYRPPSATCWYDLHHRPYPSPLC
jgi:hypothetical protein